MGPIGRFFERAQQLRPGRTWFLVKRRLGQRWWDPLWLQSLWDRLRQEGGLEARLVSTCAPLSPGQLAARIANEGARFFFFGAADLTVIAQRYPGEFPDATSQIIQEANDLLQGRLHYADAIIETKLPFEWYEARAIPGMGKWHRIPAAFHWLRTLMQAFWLCQEERYAETATMLIESWLNTPHRFEHDIWRSTNFVGLRALNLLQGLTGFASYWQNRPELLRLILAHLWLHAQLLERRIEYWGYNHLIWNAHDLTLLGTALGNVFVDAARWAELGIKVMSAEIPRQIAPDGFHVERSIHYQVFVTKLLGEWIAVLWKTGRPIAPEVHWRWKQAVEVLRTFRALNGSLPLYGDGYRTADPNIEGDIEQIADFLFALNAYLHGSTEARNPLLPWKVGGAFWREKSQTHFEMRGTSSGVALTNAQHTTRKLALCYLAGNSLSGQVHAHADSLSLTLSDEAGKILIDPGGYGEVADPWREYFRSAYAHNTIVVDGQNMCRLYGVYGLFPPLYASIDGCWCGRDWCAWIAHHTNYRRLSAKVLHARTVLLGGADIVIVLDYLQGKKPFQVEQMLHFAEGSLEKENGQIWLWTAGERQWRVSIACSEPAVVHVRCGDESPIRGWSGDYRGRPVPIPSLVCVAKGAHRFWLATALARSDMQLTLRLATHKEGEPLVTVPGGVVTIGRATPFACEVSWILDL